MSFIDVFNFKKYIRKESDQTLARVGHVNAVADIAVSNEALITAAGLPSKVYKAALTQTSTNAPVARVYANTFGAPIVITRASVGVYDLTLTGAFLQANTEINFTTGASDLGVVGKILVTRLNDNAIRIITNELPADTAADNILQEVVVTISVY